MQEIRRQWREANAFAIAHMHLLGRDMHFDADTLVCADILHPYNVLYYGPHLHEYLTLLELDHVSQETLETHFTCNPSHYRNITHGRHTVIQILCRNCHQSECLSAIDCCNKFTCQECHRRYPNHMKRIDKGMFCTHCHNAQWTTCLVCGVNGPRQHTCHVLRHLPIKKESTRGRPLDPLLPPVVQIDGQDRRPCEFCNKLLHKGSYRKHIRRKHMVHTVKCTRCDKVFADNAACKIHQITHTQQKTYECQYCAEKFFYQANRSNHIKRQHPEIKRDNPNRPIAIEYKPIQEEDL